MIEIPWPPKVLSPNARAHYMERAQAAKHYRETCHWLTIASKAQAPAEGEIIIRLDFYPPDARKRDLDNMLASAKSGLDGVADGLEVNDQRFAIHLHRHAPAKPGKVVISVAPEERGE